MTPKIKAKRIVEGFYPYVRLAMGQEDYKERAKKCALIAIDLLLNQDKEVFDWEEAAYHFEYWMNVKQEIENL